VQVFASIVIAILVAAMAGDVSQHPHALALA
jgi:hypothetical protein